MFATAELGQSVPKEEYKKREPALRQELLQVQQELRRSKRFPVIILFAGVDGAGKGETVNLLNEWMDSRWIQTFAYEEPSQEEAERPEFWRYWRDLPPKGQIGLFLSAWYNRPTLDWAYGNIDEAEFTRRLDRIVSFCDALLADGALILKFWMHLSADEQERRLKALEADPLLRWRVTENDWKHWKIYDKFLDAAERIMARTSTGQAQWTIVEGSDPHYRSLVIGEAVRDAIRRRLYEFEVRDRVHTELESALESTDQDGALDAGDDGKKKSKKKEGSKKEESKKGDNEKTPDDPALANGEEPLTVLSALDMSLALPKDEYKQALKKYQAMLNVLHRRAKAGRTSTLILFEGPDAAGKGGAIRRLTASMDARNYRVLPFAAPTDEERARHYLWRFWRHLSRSGRVTILDRSWYGRVLVERVEGFAKTDEWTRAFAEINQFESELIDHGIVLLKFWIAISADEQLRRFEDRRTTPHKRWKLTDEDWRNREKWNDYQLAVHDMVARTSTRLAPWTLVEGNDKRYARIKVLQTVCERLNDALEPESMEEEA